jgi:hypothetical protein
MSRLGDVEARISIMYRLRDRNLIELMILYRDCFQLSGILKAVYSIWDFIYFLCAFASIYVVSIGIASRNLANRMVTVRI